MRDDPAMDDLLGGLTRHDASDRLVADLLRTIAMDQSDAAADPPPRIPSSERSRWFAIGGLAALAAAAAISFGVWQLTPTAPPSMPAGGVILKGAPATAPEASITLSLSLLRNDVAVALDAEASARPSDSVLMRYSTDREGFAYLFRVDADGELEVFHGTPTLAGTHHVSVGGQIVGYSLGGLQGDLRFGVAWSAEPWTADATGLVTPPPGFAEAAAIGPTPRALRGRLDGVVIDARRVRVHAP